MRNRKTFWPLIGFFAAFAVLSVIYPLTWSAILQRDWKYFEGLSFFVKSAVLGYRGLGGPLFPIQDPWCGGGLNILSNPQNRIFSPMLLLDLAFSPYHANIFSLIVYAFLGAWGMYRALRELSVTRPAAALTAVLFINGSFFGLHFAEGHIPFGSMLLIPWVLWCYLRIERKESKLLLALIASLFLLDGGVYAFIFSVLFIISAFVAGIKNRREVLRGLIDSPLFTLACGLAVALTSLPKLLPVLYEIGKRKPVTEFYQMPLRSIITSLLSPAQRLIFQTPGSIYNFQEFGCYLGIIPLVILISRWIRVRGTFRSDLKWFLPALFWLWVAVGWLEPINPWKVFQKLPLINNVHVQSRLLLLMFVYYLVLVARALSAQDFSKKIGITLFVFLCVESVFVRNFPFAVHRKDDHSNIFTHLIESSRVDRTIEALDKPWLYLNNNQATRECYEPAVPFETPVKVAGTSNYHGEITLLWGQGTAEVKSYVPGKIVLETTGPADKLISLNTNDLGSWRTSLPGAKVVSTRGNLLSVEVPAGNQEVVIEFKPWYFTPVLMSFGAGILLFLALGLRLKYRKQATI